LELEEFLKTIKTTHPYMDNLCHVSPVVLGVWYVESDKDSPLLTSDENGIVVLLLLTPKTVKCNLNIPNFFLFLFFFLKKKEKEIYARKSGEHLWMTIECQSNSLPILGFLFLFLFLFLFPIYLFVSLISSNIIVQYIVVVQNTLFHHLKL